jgi:serine/threonine protein kinase
MNAALDRERAQRFGKYVLTERLGRGGMAEVWKAKISGPAGFQRTLVVKRILPHLVEDPTFVQMFMAEARLSARLNHANIVQVYELGDVDGEYYLAMEYVRGHDLVSVVRAQLERGLPPPGMGAFVVREVCRALAYAHALIDERGHPLRLIHRDVSPSNVMMGFDGAVRLLDFGIAKALAEASDNKTVTGTLKGKFGYMSPEQVEGGEIDHRSDLFAAGVVLHEVLTGRRLFKGQSDLQTIAMVREAKVEPPSLTNPAVQPELDAVCLRALARDPEARYRGCDEMAVALDDVTHELKWGPERLAMLLRELYPDEPSTTLSVPALGDTESHSKVTPGSLRTPTGRRLAWGAAGVAAVGGLLWQLSRAHRDVVAPSSRPAAASAPAVAAPPPSPTVMVHVVTQPPGADVYLDDDAAARGQTPLALTLPRGTQAASVTVRLKGYESQTAEVMPDSDSRLQLTLSKAHSVHHGPKHAPAATAAPSLPPAARPPAPDLHRGDVVDPFASPR